VIEALGFPYVIKEIQYNLLAMIPNRILGATILGLTKKSQRPLKEPWPDLVIAAGRRTAPVARQIKYLSGGVTQLVQMMWPGVDGVNDFDLICVPNHDNIPDAVNILKTTGAASAITAPQIAKIGKEYEVQYAQYPSPKFALFCGGSTKNRNFTDEMAVDLGRNASDLANVTGGSLLVTTSRRTGDQAQVLIDNIATSAKIHQWDDEGDNPYRAFLGVADAIIVTGDSMSMCSEACSTGKPVYIHAPPDLITNKHNRLHQELYGLGCARPLEQKFEPWSYLPLNVSQQIADKVMPFLDVKLV
jgi:mitochondrial fission protein ELM1